MQVHRLELKSPLDKGHMGERLPKEQLFLELAFAGFCVGVSVVEEDWLLHRAGCSQATKYAIVPYAICKLWAANPAKAGIMSPCFNLEPQLRWTL